MKFINCFLVVIFLSATGCDWVDPTINENPNSPTDVTMDLLLTPSQAGMAYMLGGYTSFFSAWFTQQMSGGEGQASDYANQYRVNNTAGNRIWRNSYRGYLGDMKIMMEKADELKSPHYKGVGQILTALTLGYLTDMFGNIPWSEALNAENTKPKYDTQEQIYTEIDRLLSEGITNLSLDAGQFPIGDDDLIFSGDAKSWILAARGLRARYALHKSKLAGFDYQDVLDLLNVGTLKSVDDDMDFMFGTTATENCPLSQMHTDRISYMIMGGKYVDMMLATNDPRLPFVAYPRTADNGGGYAGGVLGKMDPSASLAGGPYYAPKSGDGPVYFLSFAEIKFIEAECELGVGNKIGAADAYNKAVVASLEKIGARNAAWEAVNAAQTAGTINLETIINGKYLALFNEMEVWTDWRRTNFPSLTLSPEADIKEVPRRMPYPDDAATYNKVNMEAQGVAGVNSLTHRVWWDK